MFLTKKLEKKQSKSCYFFVEYQLVQFQKSIKAAVEERHILGGEIGDIDRNKVTSTYGSIPSLPQKNIWVNYSSHQNVFDYFSLRSFIHF